MGITGATQNAFNRIWSVPFKHRPNFLHARLRGLGMLAILGTLFIVSTTAAGFVGSVQPRRAGRRRRDPHRVRLQPRAVHDRLQTAHRRRGLLAPAAARGDRRGRLLAAAPAPRRLLRRPRAQAHGAPLRRLRARARPARVAVSRRPADDLRRRDQRRARAPAVAAQLLLRPAARGRPARAHLIRRGRGAGATSRTSTSASRSRGRPFLALQRHFRHDLETTCARNHPALY